jgi:small subunit ribosomal protein S17e
VLPQTESLMGRIKTQLIKRTSRELVQNYPTGFSASFEENKKKLAQVAQIPSKKMRNSIAGYIARISKRAQDE